jgi:DNA polymerase (family 10)
MNNSYVAQIFSDIAKILRVKNENIFRIRAYERAAQTIEGLCEDLRTMFKENKLNEIPGIGKDLSEKIKEILKTGKLKFLEELKKTIPPGLLDILDIPSVGPKTAKLLYESLKIKDVGELERAARSGRLTELFGIKEKTVQNILKGIQLLRSAKERMNLGKAVAVADEFLRALKNIPQVKKISPAGSLRRMKETIRDIDILVVSSHPQKIMDAFTKLPAVKQILAKGETKSSIRTSQDVQVDVRIVTSKSYGAALLYFTGSKNFNIKLRQIAQRKNLKINEYGIFSVHSKKEKYLGGRSEEEIFRYLGLSFIEPEMREDRGEIELAAQNRLPRLIEISDIKGDLHIHSAYSDGKDSIKDIAQAAKKYGYKYIAITDHSEGLRVAGGLTAAELKQKKNEIDKLNEKMKPFRILFGAEVEIDSQGKIDYSKKILSEFDIVIGAIHFGFRQSKEQLTKRILSACGNPYIDIIAHPTGRLWTVRDSYEIDFDKIYKVAKDTNTVLEINAFPDRLDLNDVNARRAKEYKVKLAINTDSHAIEHLAGMKFGVAMARRAWLEKPDIINTQPVAALLKSLK